MDFDEFVLPPDEWTLDNMIDILEGLAFQARQEPQRNHFARLAHVRDKDILLHDLYEYKLAPIIRRLVTSLGMQDIEFRIRQGNTHREGWGKDYILTAVVDPIFRPKQELGGEDSE